MRVIGIDLGGTKIKAGLIGPNGEIIQKLEWRTPVERGRTGILSALGEAVTRLRSMDSGNEAVVAVGIGTAGRVHQETGTITFATDNLPGWTGTAVKAVLEKEYGLPVVVENDVKAAALGESWLGAASGWRHFAFVALGTGVGGALVYNGEVISGPNGGPDIGHIILCPQGVACSCGQQGCLERYVSGTALNSAARAIDAQWDSRTLMSRYADGDPRAVAPLQNFTVDLCTGLITLQNMFDPQTIVLGGGVMDSYPFWKDLFLSMIRRETGFKMNVIPARLGNDAGMMGAARLAWDEWQ